MVVRLGPDAEESGERRRTLPSADVIPLKRKVDAVGRVDVGPLGNPAFTPRDRAASKLLNSPLLPSPELLPELIVGMTAVAGTRNESNPLRRPIIVFVLPVPGGP